MKVSLNVIITKILFQIKRKLAFLLVTRVYFFYWLIFMSFPLDTHQTKLSVMAIYSVGETQNANICMQLLLALSSFSFLVNLLLLNTLQSWNWDPTLLLCWPTP